MLPECIVATSLKTNLFISVGFFKRQQNNQTGRPKRPYLHIALFSLSHLVLLLVYLLAVIEAEYSAGYRHNLSEQNHLLNYTRKGLISRCEVHAGMNNIVDMAHNQIDIAQIELSL